MYSRHTKQHCTNQSYYVIITLLVALVVVVVVRTSQTRCGANATIPTTHVNVFPAAPEGVRAHRRPYTLSTKHTHMGQTSGPLHFLAGLHQLGHVPGPPQHNASSHGIGTPLVPNTGHTEGLGSEEEKVLM